jgi:hypothetical protein
MAKTRCVRQQWSGVGEFVTISMIGTGVVSVANITTGR